MKKVIFVALLVAFVAVCIMIASNSNRESDNTISRIDAKIERYAK